MAKESTDKSTVYKKDHTGITRANKNKKREQYLNKIIKAALDDPTGATIKKKPIDFLKETTGKTVLYKYCSVSDSCGEIKPYVITAIENQTLSCSDPSIFNDPFDCKLGITFRQLYEYKFKKELESISTIISDINDAIDRKKPVKSLCGAAMKAYKRIITDEDVIKAIKSAKRAGYSGKWSRNESKAVIAIVKALVDSQRLSVDIQIIKSLLPRLEENFKRNGKLIFDAPDSELSYEAVLQMNGIDDVDEVEGHVKYYKMLFPDKPEPALETEKLIDQLQEGFNKRLSELFRVACLGESYLNRLMWSHYAVNHTGICIEYDFSKVDNMDVLPVCYSNERPQIPQDISDRERVFRVLLTKDSVWEYEDEWRLFTKADEAAGEHPSVEIPISRIYLGYKIGDKEREAVINAAKKNHISISQIKLDREKYELHVVDINL